jgi:hypothetical protein
VRFNRVRCSVVVPQRPAVKMRQKTPEEARPGPQGRSKILDKPLTCVGTAGFEPATP